MYSLYFNELRELLDLKIFTLIDTDICLARRINRDLIQNTRRKIPYDEYIDQYIKHVKYSYINLIEPTKIYADIIVSTDKRTNLINTFDIIITYIKNKFNI